jgi:hypothetical protein
MDVPSATLGASTAAVAYSEQLEKLNAMQLADRSRDRRFGMAKLAVAAGAVIALVFVIHHIWALAPLLVLVLVFVVLLIAHEKVLERMRHRERTIQFYARGMARLNSEWEGGGATGDRYLDASPSHVYARDLDLFGAASVFQYLCTAQTRSGEDTLAQWLLDPAPVGQILARQMAVRDLAPRLKFREEIASGGETVRNGVHPEMLSAWGESGPILTSKATCALTTTLAVFWLASVAVWVTTGSPLPTILMTVLNFAYAHRLFPQLERAAEAIERASDDLRLLGEVLAVIEREAFTAPTLVEVKSALKRDGKLPSAAILRLAKLTETMRSRHSLFARLLDLVTFWSAQYVFIAERWQTKFGPALRQWIHAVGEMEAYASLSAFCYEHPDYAFPDFVETGPLFEAEGLAHPLLASASAVENDVALVSGRQLMILSGPNMAGKSTFIRSIGVNAVLAQCGAPVRARRMRLSPLRVAASICILDSLSGGISRFYAEIRRVKAIADLAQGSIPVLFLFDELLSGTNSHDRFVGTQFVLQQLVEHNAIGIVSTHDLALARIPDSMEGRAFNAHFDDRLEDGKLIFDYKLKPGVVQTSNALKLMRAIGLGVTEV